MISAASNPIAELLANPPFAMAYAEKERRLLPIFEERLQQYCDALPLFDRYIDRMRFSRGPYSSYLEVPYLPVSAFKEFELRCVPEDQVVRVLQSSGTTQSVPSRIYLDKPTAFRQTKALASIIMDVVGSQKRPYLVLDCSSVNQSGSALTARGAALRGFMPFASSVTYALVESKTGLSLDLEVLERFFEETRGQSVLLSGFTYIIWTEVVKKLQANGLRFQHPELTLFHSGGWKRLQQARVDKSVFAEGVAEVFGCEPASIRDFYGMVEQVGIIFVDCAAGNKHSPGFGEVVIRSLRDFGHARPGEAGLIEVMSVLPSSYPGHAMITEDMGVPLGFDTCPCGRGGLYFRFLSRVLHAEVRGCGDTFAAARELRAAQTELSPVVPLSSTSKNERTVVFRSAGANVALGDLRAHLLANFEECVGTPTGAIVALLDAAGRRMVSNEYAGIQGIAFLSGWLRRATTSKTLDIDLGNYVDALDSTVTRGGIQLRAAPRGLVCHWIAGNIPTLAVFSWALAALAKNASILRIPEGSWDTVQHLFRAIESASAEWGGGTYYGHDLLAHSALVHFESDNLGSQHAMSLAADCRVIWGGSDAVQAIFSYPRLDHCEDVVFGPKFSIAVVDRCAADDDSVLRPMIRGIVRDAIMFDQAACSSPQILFVEAGSTDLDRIGELVEREFQTAIRTGGTAISDSTAARIISARATYALTDDCSVRTPADLSYTVLMERGAKLRDAVQGRTLFLIGVDDLMKVISLLSAKIQTIGAAFGDRGRYASFAEAAAIQGVARIVKPGSMNLYEVPWDGMMPISRLIRWCRV